MIKKLIKYLFVACLILVLTIFLIDQWVERSTQDKLYNEVEDVPHHKVGLLLGTAKFLSNGRVNLYYKYRIDAAARLFKAGKVDYILVSGDNSTKDYDEPTTIKNDLVQRGIPASKIYLDYAGFRTFDSVVRAKEVFDQDKLTVISQQFHNERALFIARNKGVEAVGYNAKDVAAQYGLKTNLRERLARVKMILDLFLGNEPKFLGEPIEIK